MKTTSRLYFIRAENGLIKIGVSVDPENRLRQLQTGSSTRLELLDTIETENSNLLESKLHKEFAKYRIHGEWFNISRDTIQYLVERERTFVPIHELATEKIPVDNLYGVQFKGVYNIPCINNRYIRTAIVSYCEFHESSLYVTEVSQGKGGLYHEQYEIKEIPNDWVSVGA